MALMGLLMGVSKHHVSSKELRAAPDTILEQVKYLKDEIGWEQIAM